MGNIRRMSHRARWLPSLCAALIAVGLPLAWRAAHPSARPVRPINPGAAVALATQPAAPQKLTPAPSGANPAVRIPVVTGAPPAPVKPAVPIRLSSTAINLDAPIDPEGVDPAGDMSLPVPVGRVGWYRYGPAPGAAAGSVVIAGHVDSATQGDGALFELRYMPAGAVVTISSSDGRVWRYRVLSRQEFSKDTVPLAQLFSRTGPPRLTLMTCGGTFDRARHSYEDNIVVTAIPLP